MLTIENENNLVGTILTTSTANGTITWHVSGIGKQLHHYIIYLTRDDNGWERKVRLDRNHCPKQTGKQYKLESGTYKMYLYKSTIENMNNFKNYLEYFI
jgi:hypothetical protein